MFWMFVTEYRGLHDDQVTVDDICLIVRCRTAEEEGGICTEAVKLADACCPESELTIDTYGVHSEL